MKQADIIIIGAGNSGCVLAKKLSQKYSIILLEAGINESEDPEIKDPSSWWTLADEKTNKYFWMLGHSENSKRLPVVTGECLGGSSTVNGLQVVSSTSNFYDDISTYLNDKDWSSKNIKKVIKKLENFSGIPGEYEEDQHGYNGPVDIRQAVLNLPAAKLFTETANQVLNLTTEDYNSFRNPFCTFNYWQLTENPDKTREEAYKAYLDPIMYKVDNATYQSRKYSTCYPITLHTKSTVTRLLFSKNNTTVKGVEAVIDGKCFTFKATQKVIIATGFQSATFLQKNGIGRPDDLKSVGIKPILKSQHVGYHLLNHLTLQVTGVADPQNNPLPALPNDYDKDGLYSGGAVFSGQNSNDRSFEWIGITAPDIPGQQPTSFTIYNFLLSPLSEGTLKLYNDDTLRAPEVKFNYLTNLEDLNKLVYAYQKSYEVLIKMGLSVPDSPDPNDIEGVKSYINRFYGQAYHWTTQCRMSPSISEGVTTSSGRVHGIKNLYIADTSIMPFSPRGNTQMTAYIIGNVIANKLLKC